eukprot:COSAG06_NODE_2455_length_6849_cov_5.464148_3_plen_168_part_00
MLSAVHFQNGIGPRSRYDISTTEARYDTQPIPNFQNGSCRRKLFRRPQVELRTQHGVSASDSSFAYLSAKHRTAAEAVEGEATQAAEQAVGWHTACVAGSDAAVGIEVRLTEHGRGHAGARARVDADEGRQVDRDLDRLGGVVVQLQVGQREASDESPHDPPCSGCR